MSGFQQILSTLTVASPLGFDLNDKFCLPLRLDSTNSSLQGIDPAKHSIFTQWLNEQLDATGAEYAAGGYGEDRDLYRMSALFSGTAEPRTLHLGIDLWYAADTPVQAVISGRVHSTADNAIFGDYGPTLILEHTVLGQTFYTLYGHLSRTSLAQTREGQLIERGQLIGWLGRPEENLGWSPHLHFQIIRDLGGRRGDYPGVCRLSEATQWLTQCPDPNLLLRITALNPERLAASVN